jgi:DHA2 family multidrug resistance protein
LFNAMRNLGGSFALAGISVLQQDRVWFHSRRIEETLNANQPAVQDYVGGLGRAVGNADAGIRVLGQTIQGQALVMTYNDIFFVMSLVTVMVMPLILFLRPLPRSAAVAGLH